MRNERIPKDVCGEASAFTVSSSLVKAKKEVSGYLDIRTCLILIIIDANILRLTPRAVFWYLIEMRTVILSPLACRLLDTLAQVKPLYNHLFDVSLTLYEQ